MPALVTAAVSWIGSTLLANTALGGLLMMNAGVIASGAMLVGGLAYSSSRARSAKRKARDAFNAAQVDRLVNVTSATAPRELVLGRVRKGGQIFFKASTGTNKTKFVMCIAIAAHEIDAVEQVYFNDEPVTLDGSGNVTSAPYAIATPTSATAVADASGTATLLGDPLAGTLTAFTGSTAGPEGDLEQQSATASGLTVITSPYARIGYQYMATQPCASVRWMLGSADQWADPRLAELFPDLWGSPHRARSVAYLICEFDYNETAFPTGLPNVTALVRGAKAFDPRQNLLRYSELFSDAAWTRENSASVTAGFAAPDGSATAFRGLFPTGTLARIWQSVSAGSGLTIRMLIWLRSNTGSSQTVTLHLREVGFGTTYKSETVTVTTTWQRFSVVATIPGISVGVMAMIYHSNTADPTWDVLMWGAQMVAGANPLAYIRTEVTAHQPSEAWSDNPAILMRHIWTHPWFGKATPTLAEDARIADAAAACDTSHGYVVDGVTATVPLYRAGMVLPFGAAAKDAFDDLAAAMAGSWAYAGGELYVRAGVFTGSVMSLTDADLVGIVRDGASDQDRPLMIRPHRERVEKFNVVNLTIWDSQQSYKQVSLTPLKGNALIARDGAELAKAITLSAVGYAPQALHIAGVMMRDARDPLTITLNFKTRAYPLELFDTIDMTVSRYGWAAKLFQVVGRDWSSAGDLALTLKEIAEAHYTPDGTFAPQGYAVNTQLPNPWFVPTIGTLIASSGDAQLLKQSDGSIITRILLTWPAVDDASVTDGGTIEIQYRPVLSSGDWSRIEVQGSVTQVIIAGVQDRNAYTIRARARNRIAVGLWSMQIVHTVLGLSAPPPIFDRFLVLAQPDGTRQMNFGYTTTPVPVDWMGAQIRYLSGTHLAPDWSAMSVLSDSDTYYTASPVEANAPTSGTYTFACRSMDTSGNLSPYLLQTITLPDRRLGSVYAEYDEAADGWNGSKTGCAVNPDGQLESIDTTTWSATPASWATWTRWNFAPTSPIVYETAARDLGAEITGQISSDIDADGSIAVELATSADGVSWSGWGTTSGSITTRYIKLRLTLTATGPDPVPLVRGWHWLVDAPLVEEYVDNVDISTLTGAYRIGVGDVRAPIGNTYTLIRRSSVVVQDSTGGDWTAVRIDQSNSPSPRWQFRKAGVLADPEFVDFLVTGFI